MLIWYSIDNKEIVIWQVTDQIESSEWPRNALDIVTSSSYEWKTTRVKVEQWPKDFKGWFKNDKITDCFYERTPNPEESADWTEKGKSETALAYLFWFTSDSIFNSYLAMKA